jgi:hypothetical protein
MRTKRKRKGKEGRRERNKDKENMKRIGERGKNEGRTIRITVT